MSYAKNFYLRTLDDAEKSTEFFMCDDVGWWQALDKCFTYWMHFKTFWNIITSTFCITLKDKLIIQLTFDMSC